MASETTTFTGKVAAISRYGYSILLLDDDGKTCKLVLPMKFKESTPELESVVTITVTVEGDAATEVDNDDTAGVVKSPGQAMKDAGY